MNLPEAAARAASRLAARAIESIEAARRIRDEPAAAIREIAFNSEVECGRASPLFERCEAFPWDAMDSSMEFGFPPHFSEISECINLTKAVPEAFATRRFKFYFAGGEKSEIVDLFTADGKPTKVAIAVVRSWAAEIVELGEQVLGQAAGDDPPDAAALVVTDRERDFYGMLVEAIRRGRGVRGNAAMAAMSRRHNVYGSTLTEMKKRLNAALDGKGWIVAHSKRLGYHLARA